MPAGAGADLAAVEPVAAMRERLHDRLPGGAGRPDDTLRRTEKYLTGGSASSWSPWVEAAFSHVHVGTHDDVVDRIRSVSHIAVLPPARRARRDPGDPARASGDQQQRDGRDPVPGGRHVRQATPPTKTAIDHQKHNPAASFRSVVEHRG